MRLIRGREPLLLIGIALIILLLVFNIRWSWVSDDITYLNATNPAGQFGGSIWAFLGQRLNTWTSRVAIEAALFSVVNHVWLWRLLTALAFWLLVVLPPLFTSRSREVRLLLLPISGFLVLSIPNTVWFDAGFMATSANYLWALAATLLAALPAIFIGQLRKFSRWWYLASVPALLYAGSSELAAVLLAALYAVVLAMVLFANHPGRRSFISDSVGVLAIKRTRVLFPLALYFLFLISMVIFHITSPGNAARGQNPDWFGPTAPVIFERAYSATLNQIFMSGYVAALALFGIIGLINYRRYGWSLFTLIAMFPVFGTLLLSDRFFGGGTMGTMFNNLFRDGNLLWDATGPVLYQTTYLANLFAFGFLTLLLLATVFAICTAFWGTPQLAPVLALLAAGFATKFIAVNTVGQALALPYHRTDTYLLFAMVMAILLASSRLADSNITGHQVEATKGVLNG